ncbi:MAG: GatB/YqeY domain-containing protein [Cyanobacteria bacterium P01_H01_bin.35]
MSLKDKITEEIKAAMKAKDKVRLETVRSIKKVILEEEANARGAGKDSLTETQEMDILARLAKQRRDSIEQYTQVGRQELADQEAAELAILEEYLPKQLSDDEIAQIIDEIIVQVGASSAKDMGKVMGPAMQQLKGKADGKKVQEMVKSKLS